MTRQPIEKQTNSITHCLVYKAPSNQFDSLCVPPAPVNWLISLDSVNWLVVVALCGHSSHFVRARTELKFRVWIKTSWGIGLPAPQGGMLHFDRQAEWYEIWALCNLLWKDSVCASKRLVLLTELWGQINTRVLKRAWGHWLDLGFSDSWILSFKRTVLLQGTFILLGRKQFSAWVFSEHLGSSSSVTGNIDFHRVFTCVLNVTRGEVQGTVEL